MSKQETKKTTQGEKNIFDSQLNNTPIRQLIGALSMVVGYKIYILDGSNDQKIITTPTLSDTNCFYYEDDENVLTGPLSICSKFDMVRHYINALGNQSKSDGEIMVIITDAIKLNNNIFHDTDKKTITMNKFLTKQYEPAGYLVEGLLAEVGVSIIAGSPGVGKSWTAFDIAKNVCRGNLFLGKFKTKKKPVYIVEVDDVPSVFQQRARLLDVKREDEIYIWDYPTFQINGDEEMLENFITHLLKLNIGLIIFDTFRNIHNVDENSSEMMAPILKILKTISLRCNCAVLLIHHQKKGGQDFGREADKLRGSNSIEAEATTILQLSQDTTHKAVRIKQIAEEKNLSPNSTKIAFKQLVTEAHLKIKPGKTQKNKKYYILGASNIS